MDDLEAIEEAFIHVCSLCDQSFNAGTVHRLTGQFAIAHVVCPDCIKCQECELQFDSLIEIVRTPGGNYCTDCAGELLAELQIAVKKGDEDGR